MQRSRDEDQRLSLPDSALQHRRAPRPLPLFLEMVRLAAERYPDIGEAALRGLAAYQRAERPALRPARPPVLQIAGASLLDCGGSGPPVVLVPSLINPPHILDLDEQVSLASALGASGRRALLLDWGSARDRGRLSISGHVEELLVPLLRNVGEPAALVGYCLGGTMAVAAARHAPVERVATLAAPWHFSGYEQASRSGLTTLWQRTRESARRLGALPMEVLQSAFWSLDPLRTVAKFARFAQLEPGGAEARRFVALEDWANDGDPLPFDAARELVEDFFAADTPGRGAWTVGGQAADPHLSVSMLHCTADKDRITPAAAAPPGPQERIGAGHVGMVVGSARQKLHSVLARFLAPACR